MLNKENDMIAVICGATGLVGNSLVEKLLKDEAYTSVISVSRKPLVHTHAKLTEILIENLTELDKVQSQLKGTHYYCCLGTTIKAAKSKENFKKVDFDAIIAFAKIANFHNAYSFSVISAKGANEHSPIFYNRTKGQTESALISMKLSRLLIYRPGLLLGERKEKRLLEHCAIACFKPMSYFLPKRLIKTIATDVDRLARKMIDVSNISVKGLTKYESADI
jgi:uncharacterized protein YbjT (DUF2867 family)